MQNWYPGDENGVGGIYNFVTKRGDCRGRNSKISWTQVETGSAITWKYPSCILRGDGSVGEFYSVALANHRQQADTGTKMIHMGRNTRTTIISKGISAGHGQNAYRGLVKVLPGADGARNHTQCDSLLMGAELRRAHLPLHRGEEPDGRGRARGDDLQDLARTSSSTACSAASRQEDAVNMIVNGFCRQVFRELPMEFAVEAQNLLAVSLEGAVG